MKKRILSLMLAAMLLLAILPGTALAAPDINVTVNSKTVQWTDARPFIDKNSRTMVPLRAVGEALGLKVDWNDAAKEAIFTNGSKTIYFPINCSYYMTQNGGRVTMDTAAVIVNSRTYAPIRYLAEYFGFTVSWDDSTKTVGIKGSASAPRWVLVDSSAQKADDTNNQYYNITVTYEGVKNGMVQFKRSGGYYQDPKNYARCDAYFECQQPPSTLTPGQALTLEMRFKVENYEFASSSGSQSGIMLGANWIYGFGGSYFTNAQGEKYFNTANTGAGATSGNIEKSDTFTWTVSNSTSIGARYDIKFCSNSCGTYTWTYELQQ